MALSLTNFTTSLPKALIKKAEGCTVRECDETAKGTFEGYVDEGTETFDVSLAILPNKEIGEHQCDCKQTDAFCRHKTALLLAVAKGPRAKTGKTGKTVKAKVGRAEAVLEAADVDELKEWVKNLLLKNKDLELAFVQHFAARKVEYSPEEAASLTAEAIKSVVKSRTKIDLSELKKIIDLWTGLHQPVVQYYAANVTSEKAFLAFHSLLEACRSFELKIAASSQKIAKYLESLLNQCVEAVGNLYEDDAWETATGYFIKHIPDRLYIRMHYVDHLKNILAVSSPERSAGLIDKLVSQYGHAAPEHTSNGAAYTKALFNLVAQHGLFSQYVAAFKPIRFDNEFNQTLIERLIEAGQLKPAEKWCREQIQNNYKEVYNVPYLELLKKIYTIRQDEKALSVVLADLLPFTFHFEDYLFLYDRMEEGEPKKKWRTRMITKAKNASHNYNKAGAAFYFKLLDHEKAYKKMIDAIDSYTPYSIILRYFEPMALADKTKLLKAILDKTDDFGWGVSHEDGKKDSACFPELLAVMVRHYSKSHLLSAIRQAQTNRFYFRGNCFIDYMKKALAAAN